MQREYLLDGALQQWPDPLATVRSRTRVATRFDEDNKTLISEIIRNREPSFLP